MFLVLICAKIYCMSTITTISEKIAGRADLVMIPRKEYERLLQLKKLKEFTPTKNQKRALARAEVNFKKGKTLSYHELAEELER